MPDRPSPLSPILLCLDLERGYEMLVRYAATYAARSGQPVHVLYVMPRPSPEAEQHAVQERLKRLVATTLPGALVTTVVVRRGRPEEEIVTYAREHSADPIVLGRRQRSSRERLHIGSTTSAVIALAPGPVLVVPLDHPVHEKTTVEA